MQINRTADGLRGYPLHKHRRYEIMFYTEGEGVLRTERGDHPFRPGTFIIVPRGVLHGSVSRDGFRNISIEGGPEGYFDPDVISVGSDNKDGEGACLARLIYANRGKDGGYLDSLVAALCHLMLGQLTPVSAVDRAVRRISAQIEAGFTDPEIKLSQLLRRDGYSEDYARARYKAITGKTPVEHLTDLRIRHACYLLEIYRDSLPMERIAEMCGYLDYVYFSKSFKRRVGVSPRKYVSQL